MNLDNIPTIKGATHPTKRLGRGEGSGHGKTSGKGHKGQKARSGGGIRIGFEGGQMPLYRKLPRRGFNNKNFKVSYQLVNVGQLEKLEGDVVDRESLIQAGLVRDNKQGVKLLGDGEVSKAYTIKLSKVSDSAKSKIEAAGGKVEVASETPAEDKEDA
ncbi:50S ribosomal protein L15 [Coraliomargarita algicola]|uniref:Large ribosomal subunit protein uL15 n=1 Tax=Coraliomargarita algicola TaxID=3092156 RepID=A0ABZ0RP92_9BACT|nr:50S ribosomal protein L15 [Coraliomargarita sp. J2-16]WPJ98054.1 50S ribosomal protein L15 [Coraliomargarita sp. J2-16]